MKKVVRARTAQQVRHYVITAGCEGPSTDRAWPVTNEAPSERTIRLSAEDSRPAHRSRRSA